MVTDVTWGRATSQWFANLDNIKDDAIAALQNVNFVPAVCKWLRLPAHFASVLTNLVVALSTQSPGIFRPLPV